MHKYQLAIENYEFSDKVISKSIMNIIKHYEGVIDDASNSTIYLRDTLADLYLDWVNNFLTIEKFSEYYGLDEEDAKTLLQIAKKSHEQRVDFIKDTEEV